MKIDEHIKCERCGTYYEIKSNIWYEINNTKGITIAKIMCPCCGKVAIQLPDI